MSFKAICILICILLGTTASFNIQPDPINPLSINPPKNSDKGIVVTLRFSLPSATANAIGPSAFSSSGLHHGQFLGVAFPANVGTSDLAFESGLTPKFGCSLTDGTNNFEVTPVQPVASPIVTTLAVEGNTAYCRLTDKSSNVPLKLGPTVTYTLRITLTEVKFASTNFLRTISLFTSTSNNPEKMIIDSIPVIGTAAVYTDYTQWTPKALEIVSAIPVVTQGPSASTNGSVIYPYNQFDLNVTIKSNTFISAADNIIVFQYPQTTVSAAGTVLTSAASPTEPLQAAIKGNLSISNFNSNTIILSGLGEDLVPGRQFVLSLKGWKALDTSIAISGALTAIVYYKNTYSVLSYHSSSAFIVQQDVLSLKANHPEFWDVYKGGAWPITFTLKTTNDLTAGGWVVIQQSNTLDLSTTGGNKVTFIASTCDFSKNDSSFDNSFGKRPNCYPLRTLDNAYGTANLTTTPYNGSGFFFFLKGTITAGKNYFVTVWAFFDQCGGATTGVSSVFKKAEASAVPSFVATIYKRINPAQLNELRFSIMPSGLTQSAISASTSTEFSGICWNTMLYYGNLKDGQTLDTTVYAAATAENTGDNSAKIGYLNYKEAFDWYVFAENTDDYASLPTGLMKTIITTSSITGNKFIYSNSSAATNSYFQALYVSPEVTGNTAINGLTKLPLPYVKPTGGVAHPSGRWVWQFPNQWFVAGKAINSTSSGCYAGWSIAAMATTPVVYATANVSQASPFTTLFSQQFTYGTSDNNAVNVFGANSSDNTSTLDANNSSNTQVLNPTSRTDAMRITSVFYNQADAANIKWKIATYGSTSTDINNATNNAEKYRWGVFTSCVKWVSAPPAITSLYTYIDIQIKWQFSIDSSTALKDTTPLSNLRLIKLFPEAGIVNDPSTKNYKVSSSSNNSNYLNPVLNHVVYTNSGSTGKGDDIDTICLLELNGVSLLSQKDSASNTLVLWMFLGTLLETDYEDASATYPGAPLNSSVLLYGLQSNIPFDKSNNIMQVTSNTTPFNDRLVSNADTSSTAISDPDGPSAYYFFFGSVLYFTGVSSSLTVASGNEKTFYVPYYCPRMLYDTASTPVSFGASSSTVLVYPVFVASWITASTYSNISSLNQNVMSTNETSTLRNPGRLFTSRIIGTNTTSKVDFRKSTSSAVTSKVKSTTIRFGQYTGSDNNLYIFNGWGSTKGASAIYCSGHTLLLSSSIQLDTTVTYNPGYSSSITPEVYPSSKIFYALGKAWNKAVFYGLDQKTTSATGFTISTANMAILAPSDAATSGTYYTGIKKPTVDSFVVGSNLVLSDKIAFSCVSINYSTNEGLTNYFNPSTANSGIQNFLMDWNPDVSSNAAWLNGSISWDKTEVYKSDVAGNFKTVLSPPVAVPANTKIAFSSTSMAGNTVCGLITSTGGITTKCEVSSGTATCTIPSGGTSFNVCCYNVVISDTISFSAVTATFPTDTGSTSGVTGLGSNYLSSLMYTANSQINGANNPFSFTTSQKTAPDVSSASVTSITYSQVNQESGIGKVTFAITLPREPTRGMKLSITQGDLNPMYVTGNVPRCFASFTSSGVYGSNWDNGDVLIDTCSANGIQNGTNPIVLTTKSIVYKCGVSFSKNLYISLWPIVVVNWSNPSVNKSFKITMNLLAGDSIALNTPSFNMALSTPTSAKPQATAFWDGLCAVSSVVPRIPGEVADYTFDIDLDTNKSVLGNTNPNEVTIFFPYQYYGSYIPNVMCYQGGMLNCSFTDEGILNIRFSSNLPIGSGKKISIVVTGITNPSIDGDYSFPCTVNNTNFSSGARTNLITGSGKLSGGITTTSVTSFGSLRFLNVVLPNDYDNNPRNISYHKFRITLDNVNPSTSSNTSGITITNTPVIHVYFPPEFKLAWYSSKPQATIDEYTSDANNVITKSSTIIPGTVVQSGNRVSITLTQSSITMGPNWRYWDITITGIPNPPDTTEVVGPPSSKTTRPYYITVTNTILSVLYRTHTNINSFASSPLDTLPEPTFPNLGWNRGMLFKFDNKKWVVDIYSSPSQLNTLTIKSGRFLQSYFSIKTNQSNAILPSITTMSLNDNTFKTSQNSYSLSTSFNQPLAFWIGCTCGTAPGNYLVNFSSSDTNNFASLSPVVITVDTTSLGIISYQTPANIPAAGSIWVGITLSDPNFDQLSVTWTNSESNDSTSKLSSVTIPVGTVTPTTSTAMSPIFATFSITNNSQTLSAQTFKTIEPSPCYTWNGVSSISFNISGQTAVIPSSLQLVSSFKYNNASTDATLTVKNSLKFTFTPPAAPIYIYCALVCFNQSYPADNSIATAPQPVANTPYLQYYSNIINNLTPIDIVFSNLVRGMQYKLKCIIYSTDGDNSKRTTSQVTIESYTQTGVSNSTTVQISPTPPQATQCIQWQFLSEPGTNTRQAVVNYCQKLYSTSGWWNNGCVICTYSDIAYNAPGLSLPSNITCANSANKKRLRMLQDASVANPNVTANVATTLTVCPVAHPICATDVSGNKVYADYFNQLINDLKTRDLFKSTLNIDNVFLNTTVPTITITDSTTPDLTKLSSTVSSSNQNGAVSWTASFSSPLNCFWQILDSSSGTPSSYNNVASCTDNSWCGKAKVGATPATVSTTNLKAFTAGTTYNIWMACTNDIPFAQRQSIVQSAGSFTIPAPPPASTNSTATPTTGSSSFISFSMMAILMIFAFLF